MKTRITELFGIQHPIIQGAMQWLSKPRLAAAVSNAGGLGTINMTTYATPEDFQAAIQELKSLTDRPFSVNLSLLPDTKPDGPIKGFLQAVVEEKVKIVETAGSSPAPLMDTLKGAGCLVMTRSPTPALPTPPRKWAATRCASWATRGAATRGWPGWAPSSNGP